jgi:hypothetical protein
VYFVPVQIWVFIRFLPYYRDRKVVGVCCTENIAQLSNSDYLIGTTDGYYIMNINDLSFKSHVVSIVNITTNTLNGTDASQSIQRKWKF